MPALKPPKFRRRAVELARLRKENSDLKMDRAFLKKASLFFAQEASDTNEKRSH